ncbi:flagellin [Arthrobacter sp. YC-RL1]|uniref:flagellin N-terminal helical domain-containing protein n=1 Tax=unclassified Arthrobacter TaxID=235627 RepID=UPI00063D879A|nr:MULTISPECIES: flagellin [unclassified Arthrobacter]ALQ31098.1 flagellin [Arthrobacter sp. YC-RL1]KLI87636.1 flagellin [Arthrobacter sp. YC-RL1]RKS19440.1 flagellin [Arthrobacter sp. AG1021]
MGMQINTNLAALNAHRNLSNTQNDLSKSLEKLSSGLRINRAADDAAGLAISEGLRSQVNGLNVAARNAQDGISVIQTAEGALTEVHSILQRVRDLAVQAGNDSNNAESRKAITTEVTALVDELGRIGDTTNFNGINLLDATAGSTGNGVMSFQIGAGTGGDSQITLDLSQGGIDIKTLATDLKAAIVTTDGFASASVAAATIGTVDTAITSVSSGRAALGAVQNRFESAINSLNVSRENLQAAESRIRDVDMAGEMVNFTRSNILSQAGTAMLAQANQSNQGVLKLLG